MKTGFLFFEDDQKMTRPNIDYSLERIGLIL